MKFQTFTIDTDRGLIVLDGSEKLVLPYGLQRTARKWNVGLRKWTQDLNGRVFCKAPSSNGKGDILITADSLYLLGEKVLNHANAVHITGEFAVFIGTHMVWQFETAELAEYFARVCVGGKAFARTGNPAGWFELIGRLRIG